MIEQMNFLGLVVKDVSKATEFYTQKLGLTVNQQQSIPNIYTQFEAKGDTIFGLVGGFSEGDLNQTFDAGLVVSDIDKTYAEWQVAGVEMVSEPKDMPFGRTFLFRTPDGHILRAYAPPAIN